VSNHASNHAVILGMSNLEQPRQPRDLTIFVVTTQPRSKHANHAAEQPRTFPPLEGGVCARTLKTGNQDPTDIRARLEALSRRLSTQLTLEDDKPLPDPPLCDQCRYRVDSDEHG
jgi:hypothetical protein